jgi:hypothetical protein
MASRRCRCVGTDAGDAARAWEHPVVTRSASDALLDSFGQERRPVATQVLALSHSRLQFATAPRSLRRAVRDANRPGFRLPQVHRHLADDLSHIAGGYPDSPLTRPGRVADLPSPGGGCPIPPSAPPGGPRTLYAALRRGRHVLVTVDQVDVAYGDLVEVVTAPLRRRHAVALVRPDGYLTTVGTVGDSTEIRRYLHDLTAFPARGDRGRHVGGPRAWGSSRYR